MATGKTHQKIYVIIVHGIGTPRPGYARPLIQGITSKFNHKLQQALKTKSDQSGNLVIREVIWDEILAVPQEKLAEILKKSFKSHAPVGLRALFSYIFSFVTRLVFRLRTTFAAESISDIIGYKNKDAYPKIHLCLEKIIDDLAKSGHPAQEKNRISIISHSLGTVISSDYIYDRVKKFGHFHDRLTLANFFTLGSPIALFALQYGVELFKSPVRVEDPSGQWINIFDLDDPIAYPLKKLNEAYDRAVSLDAEVNTGGFGTSHTRYFINETVQEIIASKLSGDWLNLNKVGNRAEYVQG